MQVVLCYVANGVNDDFVIADLIDSAVTWFSAKTEMDFTQRHSEMRTLARLGVALRFIRQFGDCSLKCIKPAQRLLWVAILRPPQGCLLHSQFERMV